MIDTEKQQKLEHVFRHYGVTLAYLFGSAAKGTETPLSDLDIAVVFSESEASRGSEMRTLAIAKEVGTILEVNRVDIIDIARTRNPLLRYNIVSSERVLFNADPHARFRIEKQIMDEYEDTKHLRNTAYAILQDQIKRNTFGKVNT